MLPISVKMQLFPQQPGRLCSLPAALRDDRAFRRSDHDRRAPIE